MSTVSPKTSTPVAPQPTDHKTRAKNELAEIPKRFKEMVTDDKFQGAKAAMGSSTLNRIFGVFAIPAAVLADALDPFVQPVRIVGHLGKAAVYGHEGRR